MLIKIYPQNRFLLRKILIELIQMIWFFSARRNMYSIKKPTVCLYCGLFIQSFIVSLHDASSENTFKFISVFCHNILCIFHNFSSFISHCNTVTLVNRLQCHSALTETLDKGARVARTDGGRAWSSPIWVVPPC